jgi:hypothetical protein
MYEATHHGKMVSRRGFGTFLNGPRSWQATAQGLTVMMYKTRAQQLLGCTSGNQLLVLLYEVEMFDCIKTMDANLLSIIVFGLAVLHGKIRTSWCLSRLEEESSSMSMETRGEVQVITW